MIDFLKKTNLFHNLSDKEIKGVLEKISCYQKKIRKGEYLAFKGDKIEKYMLVKTGFFITEMAMPTGKIMQVETIKSGREIAPSFIFGKNNEFPVDIYAGEDAEIVYFYKEDLLTLLQSNKKVLTNILNSFSNKTQFLSSKLWFSNKTIEEKLASYLLQNMDGDLVLLKDSIKNIADIFGVSRPSLSRVIASWVEEGILKREKSKILKVLDIEELKNRI